jgi:phosphoheptose isomerase
MRDAGRRFPTRSYETPEEYFSAYTQEIAAAMASVDRAQFAAAAAILRGALERRATIYACGNGGSAAISNHLLCDFLKGIQSGTDFRPSVVSLSANIEVISAIANDISYDDVFLYQLRTLADPGDVLVTISSSGNSENILRAVDWANSHGVSTIAMTGFGGGRSAERAGAVLHVGASNYGVVEDVHQMLMHSLAQYLRSSAMPEDRISETKF